MSNQSLSHVVRQCPELFLGRHVHITSFDSAPLQCTEDELASGWVQYGKVAISPKVNSTDILPLIEYNEWYLYDSPYYFADHESLSATERFRY